MVCWGGFLILAKYRYKTHTRRIIEKRKRIFAGAEGQSEIALIAWLQQICDELELALHLDKFNARGGDCLAIVKKCIRKVEHSSKRHDEFAKRIILLDSDRLEEDISHGRDPSKIAKDNDFHLIYLVPNIEGFYYRLHEGNEMEELVACNTMKELKDIWKEYKKNTPSSDLIRRFTVEDIKRVAIYDNNIKMLLSILGINLDI